MAGRTYKSTSTKEKLLKRQYTDADLLKVYNYMKDYGYEVYVSYEGTPKKDQNGVEQPCAGVSKINTIKTVQEGIDTVEKMFVDYKLVKASLFIKERDGAVTNIYYKDKSKCGITLEVLNKYKEKHQDVNLYSCIYSPKEDLSKAQYNRLQTYFNKSVHAIYVEIRYGSQTDIVNLPVDIFDNTINSFKSLPVGNQRLGIVISNNYQKTLHIKTNIGRDDIIAHLTVDKTGKSHLCFWQI